MNPPSITRTVCTRCLRPQCTCICHWIMPIEPAVDLLILQHPLEVANAKGSAPLLHLCLQPSRIVIGETFSEEVLHPLLANRTILQQTEWSHVGNRNVVLLYPETPQHNLPHVTPSTPSMSVYEAQQLMPQRLCVVVLDATWRKSRKMLYLNPFLQQLPRLSLQDMPASQYLIRKAHKPDQLSTLEATAYALMQLESNTEKYAPLLVAFNGFVAQQAGYRARGSR